MPAVRLQIVRFIDDEPQPGIVECELRDARGVVHRLIEKVPIVTAADLTSHSDYPQPGHVACSILEHIEGAGGTRLVRVTLAEPWGVETTSGECELVLDESELIR